MDNLWITLADTLSDQALCGCAWSIGYPLKGRFPGDGGAGGRETVDPESVGPPLCLSGHNRFRRVTPLLKKLLAGFLTLITMFVALIATTDETNKQAIYMTTAVVVLHQWLMLALMITYVQTKAQQREGDDDV